MSATSSAMGLWDVHSWEPGNTQHSWIDSCWQPLRHSAHLHQRGMEGGSSRVHTVCSLQRVCLCGVARVRAHARLARATHITQLRLSVSWLGWE